LRHKESVFLIVGDGEKRSFLEQLARELNLGDHIKFIGAVPYAEVSKYMNSADIFISMNDVSNLGNSVLEAMRCGKCVVVFDTGATHKVVKNGENGLLLKAGGTKEVADALVQLLEDEKLRHTLGANARKYAQGHFQTWDERIRMEIKLIEEIIKKNGGK
jgi:glycosyltransferase involved in cell wall biosynthesis